MNKKILVSFVTLLLIFSFGSSSFAVSNSVANKPIIIGEYDAPLEECLGTDSSMSRYLANVRVKSYATYDDSDGVQVYVKLYVPWYEFEWPQFTSMTGVVNVSLKPISKNTYFYETANGESTIDTDVNTGVTGESGDEGTVTVSGAATANNALNNGGVFYISYPITLP